MKVTYFIEFMAAGYTCWSRIPIGQKTPPSEARKDVIRRRFHASQIRTIKVTEEVYHAE
jgi:hypothetical protein